MALTVASTILPPDTSHFVVTGYLRVVHQYHFSLVILGIGLDQQGVLSPGANFRDVFYRLSWLRHLHILGEAGHLNFPWIHDGEP